MRSLRIGEIPFTNCCHIYHYLREVSSLPGVEFVRGVPSRLNSMLRRGEIDICLSSSIEYARDPGAYMLLGPGGIASRTEMPSIRLFSRRGLDELDGARIVLTDQSATTVAMCRIILGRLLGFRNDYVTSGAGLEDGLRLGDAVLLIGDRALEANTGLPEGVHSHDLATAWKRGTGLPFVFALWIYRRDIPDELAGTLDHLRTAVEDAHRWIADPPGELLETVLAQRPFFSREALVSYWELIAHELTGEHLAGLERFYELAAEEGLIPSAPELVFADNFFP